MTRRLLGALGADDALEEEIATEAAILCRLLEPVLTPAEEAGAGGGGDGVAGEEGEEDDDEDEDDEDEDDEDEADHHEVVYDLSDWLLEDRAQLGLMLEREGIAYSWEDTDVIVSDVDGDRLDQLCAADRPPVRGRRRRRRRRGALPGAVRALRVGRPPVGRGRRQGQAPGGAGGGRGGHLRSDADRHVR